MGQVLLKDQLFNRQKLNLLAGLIVQQDSLFDAKRFVKNILSDFPSLELKERIIRIREELKKSLPYSYQKTVRLLLQSLPPPCDPSKSDDDFGDFIFASYADFVAFYGCQKKDLDFSLQALKEINTRFSAEYAMRFFINAFPKEALIFLKTMSRDSHYHNRRLASESLRPKLPWAIGLSIDPEAALGILTQLHSDPTRYVTRSVANHLNDLSKINPDLVVDLLKEWQGLALQSPKELSYMMRHALRTLRKKAHPQTMTLLGYGQADQIQVTAFKLKKKKIRLGESLEWEFEVLSSKKNRILLDYLICFMDQKSSCENRKKVFQIKELNVKAKQEIRLKKKHLLKTMSTFKLYPGEHRLILRINGVEKVSSHFSLQF